MLRLLALMGWSGVCVKRRPLLVFSLSVTVREGGRRARGARKTLQGGGISEPRRQHRSWASRREPTLLGRAQES